MIRLAIPSKRGCPLSKVPTLRAGQSYERRASSWLEHTYGMVPQVEFEHAGHDRAFKRFIPDGLLFDLSYRRMVVVEIKSQNSELAQTQLRNYVRWLSDWFPGSISSLIVCANNPISLDSDCELIASPLDAFDHPVALLALSARMLPRIHNGLKLGKSIASNVVPASGAVGSGAHCRERRVDVASPS